MRDQLTQEERAVYEWQMWTPNFGEQGQAKLKQASILVTRCGGVGGLVALQLAAAGVGKLILAHGGNSKHSDYNRQLLLSYASLGKSRIDVMTKRLLDYNPRLEINELAENVSENNVQLLVSQADIVIDCAPLFTERFLLNNEICRQNKPMIECAMYNMEAQLTTIIPGETPCLRCIYPEMPLNWKREFPVIGAVSGTIACMAALEAIKLIVGIDGNLRSSLLNCDLASMEFRRLQIHREAHCPVCAETTVS